MTYRYPDACIIVLCKAPIAGNVKTRLMPALSAKQAMEVHITLTRRLLSWLSASKIAPILVWCSPDIEHAFFQFCVTEYGVTLFEQCEGDLGAKMNQAITAGLKQFKQVVLVGCDCPSLSEEDLIMTLSDLRAGQDVVLAPAEDGGYVMIACQAANPSLFSDMHWGTDRIFQSTVDKINEMKLSFTTTPMQWDVDTIEDWQRFCLLK